MSQGILFSRLLEGFNSGPCIKNVGERSIAKIYRLLSPLSAVSKVFEKLVNIRIVDHLKDCGWPFF